MMLSNASTILVTGGLGFIGRHVSRYFGSLGHRVIGIGHGAVADAEVAGLYRWQEGDVVCSSIEAFAEQIDVIVHCAGGSLVSASYSDPDAEASKSIGGTIEVLEYARRQTLRPRLVVLSSAAVYGAAERLPINESAALNPISPYGKSKLAVEQHCEQYGREFGLEIAIIRLFSIYGIGLRKQLFWDACQKMAIGDSRFGGTGHERRDWLHIDDAINLIAVSAKRELNGISIVNGGSGSSVQVSEALNSIHSLWPHHVPEIAFSGRARAGDPPGYEADISLAVSLGWQPTRRLADGIMEYVLWARGVLA